MKEFMYGYLVNEDGEVFSTKYGKLRKLKGRKNQKGYLMYVLSFEGKTQDFSAHHLSYYVNISHFDTSDGLQIDHIDGNKLNNNYLNLRRVTPKENYNNPSTKPDSRGNKSPRYLEIDMDELKDLFISGESIRSISKHFKCSRQVVNSRLSKLNL